MVVARKHDAAVAVKMSVVAVVMVAVAVAAACLTDHLPMSFSPITRLAI